MERQKRPSVAADALKRNPQLEQEKELLEHDKELFAVVRDGDTDKAKKILADPLYQINLEKRDSAGRTILAHAVNCRNEDLIEFMIDKSVKKTFPEDRGVFYIGDSLIYAIEDRHYGITEKLLDYAETKGWIEKPETETTENNNNNTETSEKSCFMSKDSFGEQKENVSFRFSDDLLRNPIIKASIINDYPIIQLLHGKKFRVVQDEKDEKPIVKLNRYKAFCSPSYLSINEDDAIEVCFRNSAELVKEAEHDLVHMTEYNQLAEKLRQYAVSLLNQCRDDKEVIMIMSKKGEKTVSLLNQCRDDKQVSEKKEEDKRGILDKLEEAVRKYPRLELGLELEQKEFIARPNCQKVVEDLFHGRSDPADTPVRESFTKVVLMTAIQLVLSPFIAIYLWIFLRRDWSVSKKYKPSQTWDVIASSGQFQEWEKSYLRSPKYAALRFYGLYLVFLALLIAEVVGPDATGFYRDMIIYGCPMNRVEFAILVFVLGYSKHIATSISRNGIKFFSQSFLNLIYFLSTVCFFLAYATWGIGYVGSMRRNSTTCERNVSNQIPRYQWDHWTQKTVIASEIFYIFGTILAFFKLLHGAKLIKYVGIMQYILFQTFKDVTYVLAIYFLFLISFGVGLHLLYGNNGDNWAVKIDTLSGLPRCHGVHAEFTTFRKTMNVLGWGLFGYGEVDYCVIFEPNIRDVNGTLLDKEKMAEMKELFCTNQKEMTRAKWENITAVNGLSKDFENPFTGTEFFGYFIDYAYHLIVMILLLNLLIAKMSQTYSEIFGNADTEWKYQRTAFLIQNLDYNEFMAPPFNLLFPRLHSLLDTARWLVKRIRTQRNMKAEEKEKEKEKEEKEKEKEEKEKEKYHKFENILHQRLLHRQSEERSESAEVLDLSKELVQDTNSILNRVGSGYQPDPR